MSIYCLIMLFSVNFLFIRIESNRKLNHFIEQKFQNWYYVKAFIISTKGYAFALYKYIVIDKLRTFNDKKSLSNQ